MAADFTRDRPRTGLGSLVTTPRTGALTDLLGSAAMSGGTSMSRDEFAAVHRLYGFQRELPGSSVSKILQAGADRNAIRHAEADGIRLLAWIARFVPPGGDPLKRLVQLAAAAGCDVDPVDVEWSEQE